MDNKDTKGGFPAHVCEPAEPVLTEAERLAAHEAREKAAAEAKAVKPGHDKAKDAPGGTK